MEWLKAFELGPLTQNDVFFIIWIFGVVGGYCFGRAHAAWLVLDRYVKEHS